jgi:hypothetical protein
VPVIIAGLADIAYLEPFMYLAPAKITGISTGISDGR